MAYPPRLLALLCTAVLAWPGAPHAATIVGRVVAIQDGDTLTILVRQHQTKVRLADIDAPESSQPFGQRSRQSLSDLCFGKPAEVEDLGPDRYGRTIGRVRCAGTDANTEQVRRGLAWVFDRYTARDSPLHALQAEARSQRRGLWHDPNPVSPWDWRASRRER